MKYEYKIVWGFSKHLQDELNKLGKRGWVAVSHSSVYRGEQIEAGSEVLMMRNKGE